MIKKWNRQDSIFDSVVSLQRFLNTSRQMQGERLSPRILNHFARDWKNDPAITRIGLTAIRPVVYVDAYLRDRITMGHLIDAVECTEGLITGEEVRLAEQRSGYMPSLDEIAESMRAIRSKDSRPQTVNELHVYGYRGPGIREYSATCFG